MNLILSMILSLACAHTNVLIAGDSQADNRTWGAAIESEFEECGANVDRYSMPGWPTTRIWSFLRGEEDTRRYGTYQENLEGYNIVILISGDNDVFSDEEEHLETAVEMVQYFEDAGSNVVFSIPPPATVIGSMRSAAGSFPYLRKSEDRRYWFNSGLYEDKMIYRESLRSFILNETDAHVWDLVEIAENCNVRFPRFPDGLHIEYRFAQSLAECIVP